MCHKYKIVHTFARASRSFGDTITAVNKSQNRVQSAIVSAPHRRFAPNCDLQSSTLSSSRVACHCVVFDRSREHPFTFLWARSSRELDIYNNASDWQSSAAALVVCAVGLAERAALATFTVAAAPNQSRGVARAGAPEREISKLVATHFGCCRRSPVTHSTHSRRSM